MLNTRSFCDQENHEHAIVPPIVDVRDNLGVLAIHVLSAKEDLAKMDYETMIHKLYDITCELHTAYDRERTRIDYHFTLRGCHLHSRGFSFFQLITHYIKALMAYPHGYFTVNFCQYGAD